MPDQVPPEPVCSEEAPRQQVHLRQALEIVGAAASGLRTGSALAHPEARRAGAGAEAAAFSVQFGDEVEAQVRTLLALLSLVSDPVEGNDRMGNHIDADH